MRESVLQKFMNFGRSYRQSLILREFNEVYYDGLDGKRPYETTSWLGVNALKCPLDMWIYQEILFKTKPEIIIETGVYCGGSTLYLASICDLLGAGSVLACDINLSKLDPKVAAHPRVKLFEGSSVDPGIVKAISDISQNRRTMVILDSDHREAHVLEELNLYSPLVSLGCYLICEDTNVNGHPVFKTHGPGPYEAVKRFLDNNDTWQVDHECERLLLTFNPGGYLLRKR